MRICFVQSPTGRREMPIYPLGIAFLAGQLRQHVVSGLDLSLEEDPDRAMKTMIDDFRPEVIAISLRNIDDSSYPVTYSYLKPFSRLMEGLEDWPGTVIVGGTGFSIYSRRILADHARIDFGIPGEGEEVLPQLLAHLERGSPIQGWSGERLLPRVVSDLSIIQPPDYDLLDTRRYPFPDSVGVQSRRGCAFGCSYCTYGYLSGRSFRKRPVEDVIRDIAAIRDRGVERFQFVDSVFNAPAAYFQELLQALKGMDERPAWSAWLDTAVTDGQLQDMRDAGAVKVDFSPDAITDRGLRALSKKGRAPELYSRVKAARATGMQVSVNFFNGNPEEGFAALLRKIFFMLRARILLGWKDTFVNIGTIRVYAHSPMAEQMLSSGEVDEDCQFYRPVFCRRKGPGDWLYRFYQRIRRMRHG